VLLAWSRRRRADTPLHPHDPSWQNWPALEHRVIATIVPDFPLINSRFKPVHTPGATSSHAQDPAADRQSGDQRPSPRAPDERYRQAAARVSEEIAATSRRALAIRHVDGRVVQRVRARDPRRSRRSPTTSFGSGVAWYVRRSGFLHVARISARERGRCRRGRAATKTLSQPFGFNKDCWRRGSRAVDACTTRRRHGRMAEGRRPRSRSISSLTRAAGLAVTLVGCGAGWVLIPTLTDLPAGSVHG